MDKPIPVSTFPPAMSDAPAQSMNAPLRVLHISGRSDHGGGPEHIYQVIGAQLAGIEHYIACPDDGVYWARYRSRLGSERLHALPHRRLSLRALWRLRAFTRSAGIQVIHSHGTCGGVYGRLIGSTLLVPVVHSFHGVPVVPSIKHSLYSLAERALCHATRCGVAVSAGEAELVHKRWKGYRGKLAVVPNGIDTGAQPATWTSWPKSGEPLRIVSFTRRNHQKYPELLIEIARILRVMDVPFRIDAYGEGLDHPTLAGAIAARGLEQHLRFHLPTDQPVQALADGHIYLSTSRWEGMPAVDHRGLACWPAGRGQQCRRQQ